MNKEMGILLSIMMVLGFILALGTEYILLGEMVLVAVLGTVLVCIVAELDI